MRAKEIYDIGQMPPLGVVPELMYAALVRPERYGPPKQSIKIEPVPVPKCSDSQVLVLVMAAGINFNAVWAALGYPLDVIAMRQKRGETEPFHIGGTEGAGIVWATGRRVTSVAVGQPIVVTPFHWDEKALDVRMGAEPVTSTSLTVWGYEDNWGSYAQFAIVEEYQCYPKPPHLTWEQASCFMACGGASYRQLTHWHPHTVRPGDPVLIWGGAGGLGCFAIQITRMLGGIPIAVVSTESRGEYCKQLGAAGVINRTEFSHWGRIPDFEDSQAFSTWLRGARSFGEKFWQVLGQRRNPKIVFEHSGRDTLPTSIVVCDNAGMVVTCGGTTGYNGDLDLRFLWMRSKRLQGSHAASAQELAQINALITQKLLLPCLTNVVPFQEIADIHQTVYENCNPPGKQAVLINAPEPGLTEVPRS
jgi:crotonyl-CoA carboxylase/reductase